MYMYVYIYICRLMRRRIKVADMRIFLIYVRKWSMNIIMNIQQYETYLVYS